MFDKKGTVWKKLLESVNFYALNTTFFQGEKTEITKKEVLFCLRRKIVIFD